MLKIGQADPDIICLKEFIFLKMRGAHTDDPLKLQSYWTEVHLIYKQYSIFIQCSQIIADKPFKIRTAILQSVAKCQGDE